MSEVYYKNWSESTTLSTDQRNQQFYLRLFTTILLVVAVTTCIIASVKAGAVAPERTPMARLTGDFEYGPAGPNYGTYLRIAVGTGVAVLPILVFTGFAFAPYYKKSLSNDQIETLRGGNFNDVRTLLFWDCPRYEDRRVASLEEAVRSGRLTPEDVAFFDTVATNLNKKLKEIEAWKQTGYASVPSHNSTMSEVRRREVEQAQSRQEAYQAHLNKLQGELAQLNKQWTEGQIRFKSEMGTVPKRQ